MAGSASVTAGSFLKPHPSEATCPRRGRRPPILMGGRRGLVCLGALSPPCRISALSTRRGLWPSLRPAGEARAGVPAHPPAPGPSSWCPSGGGSSRGRVRTEPVVKRAAWLLARRGRWWPVGTSPWTPRVDQLLLGLRVARWLPPGRDS